MNEPITNKAMMYQRLSDGCFGNTIPQFFSVESWLQSRDSNRYQSWGVRTLSPGGPCRLYCPVDKVVNTVTAFEQLGHQCNISCMIDEVVTVTMFAEVFESTSGLVVYGIEHPGRGASWRKLMPTNGRNWQGVAARMVLRKHLNANSLDDLEMLLRAYPGHVVEFSATMECFGVVPHRNAVIWEVRSY